MKQYILKSQFLILVVCLLLLISVSADAAFLYLEPSDGEHYLGDTFIVGVRIDTQNECINTVEANLSFSKDVLDVIDFSGGNSILTLWLQKPIIDNNSGIISFAGGVPGGYCGRLSGDSGESNLLGKIIFKVKQGGQGWVKFLNTSQVLLNDGLGTQAKVNTADAAFILRSAVATTSQDNWTKERAEDTIMPESFLMEISRDPSIFEGKYFISFSTQDKQTGIDRYEVLETRDRRQETGDKQQEIWKKTESPYLLEDQTLSSIIKVKAIDKAENERIAEYIPKKEKAPFPYWIIIWIILAFGAAGVVWRIAKRFIK
ncbi:MAG: cohesin domain-containing protein [bacterium]|nr:cohesin domain-containing protein [bacterium]